MTKRIKRVPFYQQLGMAIMEKKTFSINDMEGADKVYYPIAKYMLRSEPEQNIYLLIGGYVEAIEKSLNHAIGWIENQGIPVYRKVPQNQKNIEAISVEAEFKDYDLHRIEQALRRGVGAKIISIKRKHPEALPATQQRLLLESFK